MRKGTFKRRVLALAVIVAALITTTYAFTNTNTFTGGAPRAGSGNTAISGYTVSSVSYTQNASNPENLDSVKFVLSASASSVKVRLDSTGSQWYSCSLDTSTASELNDWVCATTSPAAAVTPANQLDVVALG